MLLKCFKIGEGDTFEVAFLAKDIEKDRSGRSCISIPEHVDHIVQVAGPRPFGKGADFLGESLLIGIGLYDDPAIWNIAVWMKDRHLNRRQDDAFIRGQVKFDTWCTLAAWRYRPLIADSALAGFSITRIIVDFELLKFYR